ncbi:MAG: amidohydrolase family protein [Hyphomicrobiales bacterium]|nr:amidohydrolase family protein [Hyphomicrobiales bacterium]
MVLSATARDLLTDRISRLGDTPGATIDADTHITDLESLRPDFAERMAATPDYFHGRPISAELLLNEMAMAGVDMALVWQNPSATAYGDDRQQDYAALLAANAYVFESSSRFPGKLLPAGWTDPKALGVDLARQLIDVCVEEFGFPVVKMNPAQNAFPIDSEAVLACVDRIVELGAVPAFHYGADTEFTPPEGFASVAARHPAQMIIGVHMGGGGAGYVEAEQHAQASRKMINDLGNVFFIESAKRDTHIESDFICAVENGSWRRTAVGSDAPYGRMTWNFGGSKAMLASLSEGSAHTDPRLESGAVVVTREVVGGFLGDNIRALMIEACRSVLDTAS